MTCQDPTPARDGDDLAGMVRRTVSLQGTAGDAYTPPAGDVVGTKVSGLPSGGWVQPDASQGAAVCFVRDGDDRWEELRAGAPRPYRGDSVYVAQHSADPEPTVVLYATRGRVVLPVLSRRRGIAQLADVDDVDLKSAISATALTGTPARVAVTPRGRFVTVDGAHGCARAQAIGLTGANTAAVLRHGVSMPVPDTGFEIGFDPSDRTTRIRLLWSDDPLDLGPVPTVRTIVGTLAADGAAALAQLVAFQVGRIGVTAESPVLVVHCAAGGSLTYGWIADAGAGTVAEVGKQSTVLAAGVVTEQTWADATRAQGGVYFFRCSAAATFRLTFGMP